MNKLKWIPNFFTSLRIVGAIALIFVPSLGLWFYIIYAMCGVSDVLDGFLARRLHTASTFGAKLDSVADLLFYAVMLIRMLPELRLRLPTWIWYYIFTIVGLRIFSYAFAAIRLHKFASIHSILNKLTGASVFGVGLVIKQPWLPVYAVIVCTIAIAAALQELWIHFKTPKEA